MNILQNTHYQLFSYWLENDLFSLSLFIHLFDSGGWYQVINCLLNEKS